MKTIYVEMCNEIGQVKKEKAQSEIDRMNKQDHSKNWTSDDSDFMHVIDESEEEMINPCPLSPNYVWIVKKKGDFRDFKVSKSKVSKSKSDGEMFK